MWEKILFGALGIVLVILLVSSGYAKRKADFDTKRKLGKSVLDDFDAERKEIDNLMKQKSNFTIL